MARPSRGFSESIGIWKCWFLRRGENRSTRRKTSRSKDENQQQTQPTFHAESGNRTRATLVGLHGRQMLNHYAIPAPRNEMIIANSTPHALSAIYLISNARGRIVNYTSWGNLVQNPGVCSWESFS